MSSPWCKTNWCLAWLLACWVILHAFYVSPAEFFKIYIFKEFFWEYDQCQTLRIQIRTDILSVLIWVQTVCKGYQQTTKVTVQGKSQGHHHRLINMAAITHPTGTRYSHRLLRLWCKYPNTFPRPFNLSEYEVIAIMASCIRGSRGRTAITHQCQADPLAPNVCSVSIAGIFPRCCTICCFCASGRDSNQLFDNSYIDCERVLNSEKYNTIFNSMHARQLFILFLFSTDFLQNYWCCQKLFQWHTIRA